MFTYRGWIIQSGGLNDHVDDGRETAPRCDIKWCAAALQTSGINFGLTLLSSLQYGAAVNPAPPIALAAARWIGNKAFGSELSANSASQFPVARVTLSTESTPSSSPSLDPCRACATDFSSNVLIKSGMLYY